MINFLKTQYVTTDWQSTRETHVIATLPLIARVTYPLSKAQEMNSVVDFRNFMAREARKVIWAGVYQDLIGPVKELQAKALMHAQADADVADVREICGRIDKLLEYPK